MTPDLSSPAPMMITAMMATTALDPKPPMASLASMMPVNGSRAIIIRPTTSRRTHSKMNRAMTTVSMVKTMNISKVKAGSGGIYPHHAGQLIYVAGT